MFILSHPLFWGSIAVIYLFFFSHRWDPMASKLSSLSWCGQSNLDAASEGNLKLANIFFQTGINPSPKKKGILFRDPKPLPLKNAWKGFPWFPLCDLLATYQRARCPSWRPTDSWVQARFNALFTLHEKPLWIHIFECVYTHTSSPIHGFSSFSLYQNTWLLIFSCRSFVWIFVLLLAHDRWSMSKKKPSNKDMPIRFKKIIQQSKKQAFAIKLSSHVEYVVVFFADGNHHGMRILRSLKCSKNPKLSPKLPVSFRAFFEGFGTWHEHAHGVFWRDGTKSKLEDLHSLKLHSCKLT